jgi:hypothetical protein
MLVIGEWFGAISAQGGPAASYIVVPRARSGVRFEVTPQSFRRRASTRCGMIPV